MIKRTVPDMIVDLHTLADDIRKSGSAPLVLDLLMEACTALALLERPEIKALLDAVDAYEQARSRSSMLHEQ